MRSTPYHVGRQPADSEAEARVSEPDQDKKREEDVGEAQGKGQEEVVRLSKKGRKDARMDGRGGFWGIK